VANEIKIKITSDADTKGFDEANRALGETAVVAGVTDKVIGDLGDNMTESDRKGEKLGRTMAGTRDQLIKLDAGIASSVASLKLLSHSLADTDDAAQRLDIKKAISKVKSDLASSQSAHKILLKDFVDTQPDPSFGQKISKALESSIGEAPGLAVVGGGIGLALAPGIAAGLATAITGTLGVAAIAGGVALIAKDPKIAGSAKFIGTQFKSMLQQSARDAFTGPVLDSLNKVRDYTTKLAPQIGGAFKAVAPSISGLTDDLIGFADALTTNITYAIGKSGPAIGALGDLIRHTGDSVGKFIHQLADNSNIGVGAINDLDGALQSTIGTLGTTLSVLAKIYGVAHRANEGFSELTHGMGILHTLNPGNALVDFVGQVGKSTGVTKALSGALNNAADGEGTFRAYTRDTTESQYDQTAATKGQNSALKDLATTLHAQADPVFALYDATNKLNDAQKQYDKDVKKSGSSSKAAKSDLNKLAGAALDLEGATGALGDKFDGKLTPSMKATLRTAGLTNPQINALGREFAKAKAQGDKFAKNYKANMSLSGTGVQGKIRSITDDLRAFQGTWTATMITNYKTFGKPGSGGGLATGGISGAAANGSTSGGLTWVGEHGPELAALPGGTRVWSAGDSKRMAKDGGGGAGPMVLEIHAAPGASNDLLNTLVSSLRFAVRTQAGGSSNQLLNQVGVS
jgi:hypothetical protein